MRNFNFKRTKFIFGLSAAIIVLGLSACNNAQQCNSATLHHSIVNAINTPVQWEYMVFHHNLGEEHSSWFGGIPSRMLNDKLNELGTDGWMLVSSGIEDGRGGRSHIFILKRKLQRTSTIEIEH